MGRPDATRELEGMGYRLTRQRKAILDVLAGTGKHLTAEQVYTRVQKRCPRTNLATVYRNLGLMAQEGIIGRVNLGDECWRFEADPGHHHHLVCLGCGKVQEIKECPVELAEASLRGENFRLVEHRFEGFGYCADCEGGRES